MTGNELVDGIVKLINYYIDLFSTILNALFKPILNNPSNFGNEPSAYIGNLAVGIFVLILYLIVIFIMYSGVRWLSSIITDKDSSIKEAICLSVTIEIIGLIIGINNVTIVKVLGDVIGLSIIIYVVLFIIAFIAEKI